MALLWRNLAKAPSPSLRCVPPRATPARSAPEGSDSPPVCSHLNQEEERKACALVFSPLTPAPGLGREQGARCTPQSSWQETFISDLFMSPLPRAGSRAEHWVGDRRVSSTGMTNASLAASNQAHLQGSQEPTPTERSTAQPLLEGSAGLRDIDQPWAIPLLLPEPMGSC